MAGGFLRKQKKPVEVVIKKKRRRKAKRYGNGLLKSSMKMNLKYINTGLINPGAGTIGVHVYAANGLADPDLTGGGHQCRGYDQAMQFFEHNYVRSSKITMKLAEPDVAIIFGVCLKASPSPASNILTYLESNFVKWKILTPGQGPTTIRQTFNAKDFFKTAPLNDTNQRGTATQNPDELAYYHVFAIAADIASDPASFPHVVELDYNSILTEAKQPVIS